MSEGNQQLGFKGCIPTLSGFPHKRKAHLERSSRLKKFPKKACVGEAAILCCESHRYEFLRRCKNAPGTIYRDSTNACPTASMEIMRLTVLTSTGLGILIKAHS